MLGRLVFRRAVPGARRPAQHQDRPQDYQELLVGPTLVPDKPWWIIAHGMNTSFKGPLIGRQTTLQNNESQTGTVRAYALNSFGAMEHALVLGLAPA